MSAPMTSPPCSTVPIRWAMRVGRRAASGPAQPVRRPRTRRAVWSTDSSVLSSRRASRTARHASHSAQAATAATAPRTTLSPGRAAVARLTQIPATTPSTTLTAAGTPKRSQPGPRPALMPASRAMAGGLADVAPFLEPIPLSDVNADDDAVFFVVIDLDRGGAEDPGHRSAAAAEFSHAHPGHIPLILI